MKPFTQVILVLGLITLVFYALNPIEAFDTLTPSSSLSSLIQQYNKMTPEQQQAIQAQALQQRTQLGLSTGGAFSPPLAPGLPTAPAPAPVGANTTAPASPTSQASTTLTRDQLQGQTPSASQAQMDSSIKATATSTPTPSAPVTLSDQQGLQNSQNQAQLNYQSVPVPNYVTSPSFNDILRAVDSQKQTSNQQQEKKDRKRASCKHKINSQQMKYKPTACPPPDPSVWIKRNEIPCWNCKV
jgi:hypothetical protein